MTVSLGGVPQLNSRRNLRVIRNDRGQIQVRHDFGWLATLPEFSGDYPAKLCELLNDRNIVIAGSSPTASLVKFGQVYFTIRLSGGEGYDSCLECVPWVQTRRPPREYIALYDLRGRPQKYQRLSLNDLATAIQEALESLHPVALNLMADDRAYELKVLAKARGAGYDLNRSLLLSVAKKYRMDPEAIGRYERLMARVRSVSGQIAKVTAKTVALAIVMVVFAPVLGAGWILKGGSK